MTYSRCPFEPIVKGRGKEAATLYKVMRWTLRRNWKQMSAEIDRAVEESLVVGRGWWRVR